MSLNKFTSPERKLWMNIGCSTISCSDIQCNIVTANEVDTQILDVQTFSANEVDCKTLDVTEEAKIQNLKIDGTDVYSTNVQFIQPRDQFGLGTMQFYSFFTHNNTLFVRIFGCRSEEVPNGDGTIDYAIHIVAPDIVQTSYNLDDSIGYYLAGSGTWTQTGVNPFIAYAASSRVNGQGVKEISILYRTITGAPAIGNPWYYSCSFDVVYALQPI